MKTRYAVKNAKTGQLFAGFDNTGVAMWGAENSAKPYATKLEAQAQSQLFKAMGVRAQVKPEVI